LAEEAEANYILMSPLETKNSKWLWRLDGPEPWLTR